jgi:hypothetical protein
MLMMDFRTESYLHNEQLLTSPAELTYFEYNDRGSDIPVKAFQGTFQECLEYAKRFKDNHYCIDINVPGFKLFRYWPE